MKVALIGLGMVAGTYADAIRQIPGLELKSVCARRPDSADAFLTAHPDLGAAADSIEGICADPEIDFVMLVTPPNARHDIVRAVADVGKPILMEKPVERNHQRATELVEICEQAGVPLGIMLQHRARPVVRDLRQVLPTLGPLHLAEVSVPWWRPQSYYDAPGRGSYDRDGGGVMISQAIHTLDLMLSLTGPVSEVTAMTGTTRFHQMEAEDYTIAGFQFVNGAAGQFFASTASFPGRGEVVTLHHQNGSARLEAGQLTVDYQDGRQEVFGAGATSGAGADPMAFTSDWHRFVIEDFMSAVNDMRDPMVTGRAALEVHRLIEAIEMASRQKALISLPSDVN